MKVVIPMAGRGSRFLEASSANPSYSIPKPIISVKGKPMVRWAVESLPYINLPGRPARTEFIAEPNDLIFIVLQEHETAYSVSKILVEQFGSEIRIVIIPKVTRGAVETVLAAEQYIDPEDELLITDSDHFYDATPQYEAILSKSKDTAGIIPVFKPQDTNPKWSYTLFDDNLQAIQVGEKDPELAKKGAYGNIGAYYFSKGKVFINEAKKMVSESDMYGPAGKQEFYIAPLYQRLISQGMKISVAIIPKLWGLGTPSDLEDFLKNYQPTVPLINSITSDG